VEGVDTVTEEIIYYDTVQIENVTVFVAATEKGLKYIKRSFEKIQAKHPDVKFVQDEQFLEPYTTQLKEYFKGERKKFDCPFDLEGTPFQKQVWKALQTIPYGETVSYLEIAKKINNEKAVRAVGGANGKNPISIMIPCHRVIQKNGHLGGYSSGLDMKELLLSLEQRHL